MAQKKAAIKERISRIETECRLESRVVHEMTSLIASMDDQLSNKEMADALAHFLADKYDTKSW